MRVPFKNSGLLIRNTCCAEHCFKLGNFQIIPVRIAALRVRYRDKIRFKRKAAGSWNFLKGSTLIIFKSGDIFLNLGTQYLIISRNERIEYCVPGIGQLATRALDRVFKLAPEAYICPIYFNLFDNYEDLTYEHVPPKSAGGKRICLTCKACNSKAGHSFDYAISKEEAFNTIGSLDGPAHRVKLKYGDHSMNANLKRDQDGLNLEILSNRNKKNYDPDPFSVLP